MTEILFFHLQRKPLDVVLPNLLSRSLERGWRVIVKAASEERLAALDDHLWTFSDERCLPHGTESEPDPSTHPIVLTLSDSNPNAAGVLFLVEGAPLPADLSAYNRVTLLFDGEDADALASARNSWSEVKRAGHEATYWQENASGRWEKRA